MPCAPRNVIYRRDRQAESLNSLTIFLSKIYNAVKSTENDHELRDCIDVLRPSRIAHESYFRDNRWANNTNPLKNWLIFSQLSTSSLHLLHNKLLSYTNQRYTALNYSHSGENAKAVFPRILWTNHPSDLSSYLWRTESAMPNYPAHWKEKMSLLFNQEPWK